MKIMGRRFWIFIIVILMGLLLVFGGFGMFEDEALAQVREEWVARYNGLGNASDVAWAIAVGQSGNVQVTGSSFGVGTNFDITTIKYDTRGNQVWVARYNGPANYRDLPTSIAIDQSGNVYVTGYSFGAGTGYDLTTIKYDTDGNQLWVGLYNGPGNFHDFATDLVLDDSGHVYVTGSTTVNHVIPGEDEPIFDYVTIKYDADGNQLWVVYYGGGYGSDEAAGISQDSSGHVYVTGRSKTQDGLYDCATVKYDTDGNLLWEARYNGPDNSDDECSMLEVDESGYVYVGGNSIGSGTGYDYTVIKYDIDGNQIWEALYDGRGNGTDIARGLVVNQRGQVYVTGSSVGSATGNDFTTIKYDRDGNQLWEARYNGQDNGMDGASALAVDQRGQVYVAGSSVGSATGSDFTTIKYDGDGNQLWEARYNGPDNSDDSATAIAIEMSGQLYVTGFSVGSGTGYDFATIKYSQETLIENLLNTLPTILPDLPP